MAKHILHTVAPWQWRHPVGLRRQAEYHPADQSGPQPPLPAGQLPDAADAGAQGRGLG